MKDKLFDLISQGMVPFFLMAGERPKMNTARMVEWLLLVTIISGILFVGIKDVKQELRHINESVVKLDNSNTDAHNKIENRVARIEGIHFK